MGGPRSFALVLAAIAAAAATPWPADAQCCLCTAPTTSRDDSQTGGDIRLEIETSLNFDRLILFGGSQGAAVLRPDGSDAVTVAPLSSTSRR